jgi:hypothetical protein
LTWVAERINSAPVLARLEEDTEENTNVEPQVQGKLEPGLHFIDSVPSW